MLNTACLIKAGMFQFAAGEGLMGCLRRGRKARLLIILITGAGVEQERVGGWGLNSDSRCRTG